jgi:hypothetical protein
MVIDALDTIAQKDPQGFMQHINRIVASLRGEGENVGNLRSVANRFAKATYAAHKEGENVGNLRSVANIKSENNALARYLGGTTVDVEADIKKDLKSRVDNIIGKFEAGDYKEKVASKEDLFKKIVAAVGALVAEINSGSYSVSGFEKELGQQSGQAGVGGDPVAREVGT